MCDLSIKQKDSKIKYSFYSTQKTQKLDQIGAPCGTFWDFLSILSQIIKQWKGDPLVKKVSQCQRLKGGTVFYVTRKKLFWFSSLGQQVQFKIL